MISFYQHHHNTLKTRRINFRMQKKIIDEDKEINK